MRFIFCVPKMTPREVMEWLMGFFKRNKEKK